MAFVLSAPPHHISAGVLQDSLLSPVVFLDFLLEWSSPTSTSLYLVPLVFRVFSTGSFALSFCIKSQEHFEIMNSKIGSPLLLSFFSRVYTNSANYLGWKTWGCFSPLRPSPCFPPTGAVLTGRTYKTTEMSRPLHSPVR